MSNVDYLEQEKAYSPITETILKMGLGFNTSVDSLNIARVSDLPKRELAKRIIDSSGLMHTDRILFLNEEDSLKLANERKTSAAYNRILNIATLRNTYKPEDILHEIIHGNGFMVGANSNKTLTFLLLAIIIITFMY